MSLIRAISTVGSMTLASRVLGFLRDILIARYLGAAMAADCFFVAFKLPNFFRRLTAEGAFSAAFVPLFSKALGETETADSRQRARAFAEDALAVLLAALLAFTAVVQIAMPWAMLGLAPGFSDDPGKFALAVELTRLTFPYLALISLVALLTGVLNALGRFAAGAAAPILLNIVLIASLLTVNDTEVLTARALAVAVSLAGIAQFVWLMIAASRAGYPLRLPVPRITPGIRRLVRIMLPVALGAGVTQINLVIDVILASLLPEGSLSFLFYADRLNQLPLGVIGIAVGTVLLPRLSRTVSGERPGDAVAEHNRALEFALLLTLPAAAALAAIPESLIRALFEQGAFAAEDTLATARALTAFAFGLPAFVLIKVLIPGFYAREDTRTPMRIAILVFSLNIALSIALMIPLKHVGLALSTSLAAWVHAALLVVILHRRGHFAPDDRLKGRMARILVSVVGMAAALLALDAYLAQLAGTGKGGQIAAVALLVAGGMAVYAGLTLLSGATRASDLRRALRRT